MSPIRSRCGNSQVSAKDYAIAIADLLEHGGHERERVTVAGGPPRLAPLRSPTRRRTRMAVVLIAWAPSREAYEALDDAVGKTAPPGCIVHTASEIDAKVRVVEVWESQQHIDEFFQSRLVSSARSSCHKCGIMSYAANWTSQAGVGVE
jgi:quinol monooxygenase YgiN